METNQIKSTKLWIHFNHQLNSENKVWLKIYISSTYCIHFNCTAKCTFHLVHRTSWRCSVLWLRHQRFHCCVEVQEGLLFLPATLIIPFADLCSQTPPCSHICSQLFNFHVLEWMETFSSSRPRKNKVFLGAQDFVPSLKGVLQVMVSIDVPITTWTSIVSSMLGAILHLSCWIVKCEVVLPQEPVSLGLIIFREDLISSTSSLTFSWIFLNSDIISSQFNWV